MTAESKTTQFRTSEALFKHTFVESALADSTKLVKALGAPGSFFKAKAEFRRAPTRAEFYVGCVGTSLAHVLSMCQQLEHSVLYLASFRPTAKMKAAGMTRQTHLTASIENYLVRTRSLDDRVLHLINDVFALYNPPQQVKYELIAGNTHVKRCSVHSRLVALHKALGVYRLSTNSILHRQEYLEDDLRELEGLTLLFSQGYTELKEDVRSTASSIIRGKVKTFSATNEKVFGLLAELFAALEVEYWRQRNNLRQQYGLIESLEK
jgi:hypothetical protein